VSTTSLSPSARAARRRSIRRWLRAAVVLAAVIAALPGGAVADQASQPSSAAAGHIATGNFHSCAVLVAAVRCWGFGGDGRLGYGTTNSIGDDEAPSSVAPLVGSGHTVTAITSGSSHTCALLNDGTVRCWGFGRNGELGYGNMDSIGDDEPAMSGGPVFLGTAGGVALTATAISAGNGHTCALLSNGAVRCWGFNLDGRLGLYHTRSIGDNELPGDVAPIDFGGGHTAKAVSAGGFHTCAILDDDTVRCWGFGGDGRLGYANTKNIGREPPGPGDPTTNPPILPIDSIESAGPVFLGAGRSAKAITTGFGHTCAVLDDDTMRCWGYNGSGRLGAGNSASIGDDETPGSAPVVDLAGHTAKAIDAGEQHTCAVLDDGSVRCWGFGGFGQLGYGNIRAIGDNEPPSSVDPVSLGTGRSAVAVSSGAQHTCVTLDDASVRCWGYGPNGRLGYCDEITIGDDELPSAAGPVDLGAGGDGCPPPPPLPPPPPPPPPAAVVTAPPPPAPVSVVDTDAEALTAQTTRAGALRSCRTAAGNAARTARNRLRRRYGRQPGVLASLTRRVNLKAAASRRRCLTRFGRRPGRVDALAGRATAGGKIVLTFRASGSDGSKPPAAKGYVVKQSMRPIRTTLEFDRAQALCKGTCTFPVTKPGVAITLNVTGLMSRRTYYYKVAARDNVSGRTGARSTAVTVKTR
jgi:alpha-tubulin suppressor-like RCC1 family protein